MSDIPFDAEAFAQKVALFERELDVQAFRALATRDLERLCKAQVFFTYQEVMEQYPYYRNFLVEHPAVEAFINRYLEVLLPFCQCPFPLPGGRVIQGLWLGSYKLENFPLCGLTPENVRNKRVLDIGCNAGFDTFLLASMGPSEIIGIEPGEFFYQAMFLWTVYYCPNVRFMKTIWQTLMPHVLGTFDIINCQGVIYHEPNPMQVLQTLYPMLAPRGKLVIETHVTMDDDLKAQFVEGAFWTDPSWWWIPSIDTMCAMLRKCGYVDVNLAVKNTVYSRNPDDADHTVEGHPVGGRAFFTAFHP